MIEDKHNIMTPYEYLQQKGIRKIHQPGKRYNFSIEEIVAFLNEYSASKNLNITEVYNRLSNHNKNQLHFNFTERPQGDS